jgi:two-component system, NtrC family, sensor kinase
VILLRKAVDLRLAVILMVLVPLLLVFGGGGLLALGAVERQLEDRMQEDISLIARTLRLPMSRALERERDREVDQALRSAIGFGRVYGVYLYDADGKLMTQADHLPGGNAPDGAASELRQLREKDQLEDYRSMGGQEVFSLFTPLTDTGGQVIGMLQITRQVSEMREYINNLRWRVLPTLLAFSLLFILIVIVGHHFAIGRPLSRLTHSMDRIAEGDTRVRSVPSGPREIFRLGERFNLMLDGIDERDRHLAAQRERQLRLADRLRQSEKFAMAGRLAAGVAHELGTPLSVVDGHVQRLLRRQRPGTLEHDTLTKIRHAAAQMAEVVQHLLGFGRGAAAERRPVLVRRLIELAAADVRTLFASADTELRVEPGPDDATVDADEGRLREALTHLLKNALQAARGGRVLLGWHVDPGSTTLFVEDSGEGIDEEDRSRIFEPFFTTKEPGQGSGLGLAVVQGILADHGAAIAVDGSRLGGAAFTIEFSGEGRAA